MEHPGSDPEKEYYRLKFLLDTGNENLKEEMKISLQAGEIVGVLYDALLKQYKGQASEETLESLSALCVQLEMRYRYSKELAYNNFPWPLPDKAQKQKIEETAQAILDARALCPDDSLADLYSELTMPPELRRAHQENDRAVMQAYGFDVKNTTEASCVAELMRMYQAMTATEKHRGAEENPRKVKAQGKAKKSV